MHDYLASRFLKAFWLVGIFCCCFNLDANTFRSLKEVTTESFLVVRSDDDHKVLVTELALDFLNEVKNRWDECRFESVGNAGDLMPLRVLANSV